MTFTNAVSQGTITATSGEAADNVILFETNNPSVVAAIRATASGNTITIIPLVALQPSTYYTVNILPGAAGIKDIYGQNLNTPVAFGFSTSSLGTSNPSVTTVEIGEPAGPGVSYFPFSYGLKSGTGGVLGVAAPPTFVYSTTNPPINLISPDTNDLAVNTTFTYILNNATFTSGVTYYLAVKACNQENCSGYSIEVPWVAK